MKKLTAGIFTVLMGLVAASSADAYVASKGYVDEQVGSNTTLIENLSKTVGDNQTANSTAIAEAKKAGDDAAAALEAYKTTNDGRVSGIETDVSTLEGLVGTKSVATQIAEAVSGGTLDLSAYAKASDLATTDGKVAANTEAITGLQGLVGTDSVEAQINAAIQAKDLDQYTTAEELGGALSEYTKTTGLGALAFKDKVATADIENGAVDTDQLAAGSVTDDKIESVAQAKVDGLADSLNAKMNITSETTDAGKYVLTANVSGDGVTEYAWELVQRDTENK